MFFFILSLFLLFYPPQISGGKFNPEEGAIVANRQFARFFCFDASYIFNASLLGNSLWADITSRPVGELSFGGRSEQTYSAREK